jgi:hypothetical protein
MHSAHYCKKFAADENQQAGSTVHMDLRVGCGVHRCDVLLLPKGSIKLILQIIWRKISQIGPAHKTHTSYSTVTHQSTPGQAVGRGWKYPAHSITILFRKTYTS